MIASRKLFLAFFCLMAMPVAFCVAQEPQWIWSQKDAATKAAGGEVAFRKAFNVEGAAESATALVSADNAFDLFLNGRHVGTGEGWAQRFKFDIKPLLVPGRNILAVRATNAGEDPAGLAVLVEVKPTGKDAIKVPSDASWKFSPKLLGNWARPEFDDSKWEVAAALGEYGKIGPWGGPGGIVAGQAAASVDKPKNRERGLFEFKDKDRLVLLGSAFIERMQSNGYFELELISAFPDKDITVRNLGWSGDNVWGDARAVFGSRADGFKRLLSDVNLCAPSVILVCYGENEAYAGEAGLDEFRRGFETLLDALEKTGARLVIATPRKHGNVGKPFPDPAKYNADLRKYCDVMKEVAKEREHSFVDWYDVGAGPSLTENGLHLTPFGYWSIAQELVQSLGGRIWKWSISVDPTKKIFDAEGTLISAAAFGAEAISFEAQNYRIAPAGLKKEDEPNRGYGIPLEMEFDFRGLKNGEYVLKVDGVELSRDTADKFQEIAFAGGSISEAASKLLAAINEKNFLFFNRYRPQNETYLFLFRKHEQGNNAVEIPQFDPLIAEQEKIIAELKKPVKQKFELRRVSE